MPDSLFRLGTGSERAPRFSHYWEFRRGLKKFLFLDQLQTPLGFLILSAVALAIAWAIGHNGWRMAAWLITGVVVVPALIGSVFHLRFGMWVLTALAFVVPQVHRWAPSLPVSGLIDAAVAALLFGLFLKQIYLRDWRPAWSPITIMILIWAVYCLLQLINPLLPTLLAWLASVRSVGGWPWVFFPALFALSSIRQLSFLINAWLALLVAAALHGIWQAVVGLSGGEWSWIMSDYDRFETFYLEGGFRVFSFLEDPAVFGVLMAGGAMLSLGLMFGRWIRWPRRLLLGASALVMIIAMVFSGTRTAFVALPGAYVLVMLLTLRRSALFGGVGLLLVGLLVFLWPGDNVYLERVRTAFQPQEAVSLQVRLENQEYIQPFVREHPLGAGLGSTGEIGQRYAPYTLLSQFPPKSGYVRTAVEMGWVGLGLYLLLLFTLLAVGVRGHFRLRDPRLRTYSLALLGMSFVFVLANYPQEVLTALPIGILFFMAGGFLLRMRAWDPTARK
ncbi:MAG: O-antigen ligase domain-containing protein [Bacteroidetes bacterium]|nr:MAG: O-antigen ligase domain-containing protein [Bacteroidota bacterium]